MVLKFVELKTKVGIGKGIENWRHAVGVKHRIIQEKGTENL